MFVELEECAVFQQNTTPPDHAPPRWTRAQLESYLNQGDILKGIFDQDRLVAFYMFRIQPGALYVTELAVHPRNQGKGIGKRLLQLLDKEAIERGTRKCTLTVDPFNGPALHLYFHHGYQITAYKKSYFGEAYPHADRFWMEKRFQHSMKREQECLELRVDDAKALEAAFENGFVGTGLIRAVDQNSKHNLIILRK